MDKIPFEEQRVIDELVEFKKTRHEPRDLATHIDRLSGSWGSGVGANFLRKVCGDLRTDKRSKYDALSASRFKELLEAKYNQLAQEYAERQAQAQAQAKADAELQAQRKAKELEEQKERAKADFEALGKLMAETTNRTVLVELGRRRADLVPYTGVDYVYENHCWRCYGRISSEIHPQCPFCRFYICSSCAACLCDYPGNSQG